MVHKIVNKSNKIRHKALSKTWHKNQEIKAQKLIKKIQEINKLKKVSHDCKKYKKSKNDSRIGKKLHKNRIKMVQNLIHKWNIKLLKNRIKYVKKYREKYGIKIKE